MPWNVSASVGDQLYEIAGIRPSRNWLNGYRRASQQQYQQDKPAEADADAILEQILYQDLRDVVREVVEEPTESSSQQPNNNSQQWRQLVRSLQPSSSNNLRECSMKARLSQSFRLMIQVEELVDVAQNDETRLSGGSSGGNPQQRCLKLCVSDGYYENGTSRPPNSHGNGNDTTEQQAMLAMEVSPIPNLSIKSKAGIKILLNGPIEIRWGVLLLHEGNALVLGGYVEHLAQLQTKALEEAKREAGVGVDPTIRALVWNPLTGDEQDEDEGEAESGDVRAAPPPPPPPMGPQGPIMPIFNAAAIPNRQPPANLNPAAASRLSQQQQHQQQARRQPLVVSPTATPRPAPMNNSTRPGQGTSPTLPRQQQQQQQHPLISAPSSVRANSVARPTGVNPYARSSNSSRSAAAGGGAAASSTPGNSANSHQQQMDPNTSAVSTGNPVPPILNCQQPARTSQNMPMVLDASPPAAAAAAAAVMPDVTMADATTTPAAAEKGEESSQNISFRELRELLTRAMQDCTLYSQTFGKVFVVSAMKQVEQHHYFQIEKVKKEDRKKEDKKKKKKDKSSKYTYGIHAKFSGRFSDEGRITCAISSDIIEPYFGISAAELRNISRSNKARGQVLTNEGGTKLKEACYKLAQWEVSLYHSPDEIFRSTADPSPPTALDGKAPILTLRNRNELA